MPTSSTPLDVASNTSKAGTMAPAGSVSTFSRPPDIFSTVSAQSLKIRWKFAEAGCEDCPFRTNLVVWASAGCCEAMLVRLLAPAASRRR